MFEGLEGGYQRRIFCDTWKCPGLMSTAEFVWGTAISDLKCSICVQHCRVAAKPCGPQSLEYCLSLSRKHG